MFWLSVSFVAGFVLGRINRPWKSINKKQKDDELQRERIAEWLDERRPDGPFGN
jgi:hypothetical protein